MTTPTVPLIDGAYYWVRWKPDEPWMACRYDHNWLWFDGPEGGRSDRAAAISGPIPTPDGEGE